MKKNELKNGDIVLMNCGSVAVVIGEGQDAYLLYQYGGFENLDEYDDNMCNKWDDEMVMQVFRSHGCFGLEGVDEEVPFWERDEDWGCPNEKEREEQHRISVERQEAAFKASLERMDEARNDMIYIIAQGYYGNRTGTGIHRNEIDYFLKGFPSPKLFSNEENSVDRRIIKLPSSKNVVIVYDQNQEDEYMNVNFPKMLAEEGAKYFENTGRELTPWVSCSIPEIGVELHSRCFACRIDENGELQSLEDGDDSIFINYFPVC